MSKELLLQLAPVLMGGVVLVLLFGLALAWCRLWALNQYLNELAREVWNPERIKREEQERSRLRVKSPEAQGGFVVIQPGVSKGGEFLN